MSVENRRKPSIESLGSIISINSGSATSLSSMDSRSYSFDDTISNNVPSVDLNVNNNDKLMKSNNNLFFIKKNTKRREREVKQDIAQSPNIESVISKLANTTGNELSLYTNFTTSKQKK
tara:strand:- start:366 stop:722 length:357 start_codon:yes stop_codon:yes gene_type:complete